MGRHVVHPCKSSDDLFGRNPHYRMHAYETNDGKAQKLDGDIPLTICELHVDPDDAATWGSRLQFAYICDVCFPAPGETVPPGTKTDSWTEANPWDHGSEIHRRGFSEEDLCTRYHPKTPPQT
jgi:hypothetical protein